MEELITVHPDVLGTILAKHRPFQEVTEVANRSRASTIEKVKISVLGNGRIRLNSSGCEENGENMENIDIQISGNYRPFVLYIHTDNGGHTIDTEGDIGVLEKPDEPSRKECVDRSFDGSMAETSKTHRRNQSAGFVFVQGVEHQSGTASNPTDIPTPDVTVTTAIDCSDSESAGQETGGTSCQYSLLTPAVARSCASISTSEHGVSSNDFDEIDSRLNDVNCNPTHEYKLQWSSKPDLDNTPCNLIESVDTGKPLTNKKIVIEEHVNGCAFGDKNCARCSQRCTCKRNARVINDINGTPMTDTCNDVNDSNKPCPARCGSLVGGDKYANSRSDQCPPVTTRCDIGIRQSFVQLLDKIYLMELCDHMYQNYVIDKDTYQLMFEMSLSSKERDAKRHLLLHLSKRSVDRGQMEKSLNESAQYQLIPCFFPDVNTRRAANTPLPV